MPTRTTLLALVVALTTPNASHAQSDAPAQRVIQLAPYTVHAVFPAITVRFRLSRQNLFDTLTDPIAEARVVWVETDDPAGLRTHDVLVGLNGTDLEGLTLRQIATLVSTARERGTVVWKVRRGLETVQLRHDGNWRTPLPGLSR
jgi:hypothetical protein